MSEKACKVSGTEVPVDAPQDVSGAPAKPKDGPFALFTRDDGLVGLVATKVEADAWMAQWDDAA